MSHEVSSTLLFPGTFNKYSTLREPIKPKKKTQQQVTLWSVYEPIYRSIHSSNSKLQRRQMSSLHENRPTNEFHLLFVKGLIA